jgi:spermidine synthase
MIVDIRVFLFSLIFFLSGATALIYQVAWMRKLSLFFGSDVYSAAVTLSAFMAGLSLGSWISGRLSRNATMPLLAYGALELFIAIYAITFGTLMAWFDPILSHIYSTSYVDSPATYQVIRATIAFVILLPPTILMGATLPLVVQQFAVSPHTLGARFGHFYAVNTAGAVFGTLLAGFLLLPMLGITRSILLSAAINIAIGFTAIALAVQGGPVSIAPEDRHAHFGLTTDRRKLVALAMGVSGFAALALEVVWMRLLVQFFSATVYAFATMVASFLLGIFLGSARESRIVDRRDHPAERLLLLEVALFSYVAVLGILVYVMPNVFGVLLWGLTAITGGAFGVSSVVSQVVAASMLIVLPTLWLGATFPLAIKVFNKDIGDRALDTGAIYAANTLGALFGALCAGFILIPLLGPRNSLLAIAALFLLAAGFVWPLSRQASASQDRFGLTAAIAIGVAGFAFTLLLPQQTIANFNMQTSAQPDVIFHGDGTAHSIDIIRTPTKNILMMIDGNIEADTTLVQRRHFILKAHLPLLLQRDPRDVAVIGLGLGITLAATTRNPAVDHIRLIELSPDMISAHRHLLDLTDNVLANKKVKLLIDDGRNFLNRSQEQFDMITADPVHPRISGVGNLYSHQYYEAVRARLRPGGYILQWMPMYAISRRSFDVAFRTFFGVFPNASFWYVRGHGLFVAGTEKLMLDFPTIRERFENPVVRRDFESIQIYSAHELIAYLLMDDDHIRRYLKEANSLGTAINTDDNALLEYAVPHEFLHQTQTIIRALKPYAGWDPTRLTGASKSDVELIAMYSAKRLSSIIEELSLPVE